MASLSTRRAVHPIERASYEILRRRIRTAHLPPLTRAVVERVVHASADPAYAVDLVCDEAALASGLRALRAGAALVVDAHMVAAGVTAHESVCLVRDPRAVALAAQTGLTRSAATVRLASDRVGPGAVWVVGNAPTALVEILRLAASIRPTLVVGLPVGFVGAVEAKAALRESGVPCLSNRGEKGGSAVAAAAVNALLYLEADADAAGGTDQ